MKKVTLEDIAKKIGVSKVAVHKALTDKKGVSEPLRRKIKEYARSVNYVAKSAKADVSGKKFIFLVNRDFFLTPSEQFYSTIFYFLSYQCNEINSTLQVAFHDENNGKDALENIVGSFRPDGLFLAGEVMNGLFDRLSRLGIPRVFIDYYSPLHEGNFVYVDHYQTAYRLTKYLIGKGHRNIGFVGDVGKTSAIADRYYGYVKAFTEESIAFNPAWHINKNVEKSGDFALSLGENPPTAFICHCDAAAQWMYASLAHRGFRIPTDVSIVSFDNTALCDTLMPRLTSIGPDKDTYARSALEAMAVALDSPAKLHETRISLRLVERDSVAKPRQ